MGENGDFYRAEIFFGQVLFFAGITFVILILIFIFLKAKTKNKPFQFSISHLIFASFGIGVACLGYIRGKNAKNNLKILTFYKNFQSDELFCPEGYIEISRTYVQPPPKNTGWHGLNNQTSKNFFIERRGDFRYVIFLSRCIIGGFWGSSMKFQPTDEWDDIEKWNKTESLLPGDINLKKIFSSNPKNISEAKIVVADEIKKNNLNPSKFLQSGVDFIAQPIEIYEVLEVWEREKDKNENYFEPKKIGQAHRLYDLGFVLYAKKIKP
jgi:hypothetical protein